MSRFYTTRRWEMYGNALGQEVWYEVYLHGKVVWVAFSKSAARLFVREFGGAFYRLRGR